MDGISFDNLVDYIECPFGYIILAQTCFMRFSKLANVLRGEQVDNLHVIFSTQNRLFNVNKDISIHMLFKPVRSEGISPSVEYFNHCFTPYLIRVLVTL